ncbi:MAG: hypothetical protein JSR45_15150 [Proteobacteria bacterium]|nr:hypothetical protein [Pseudomonadota bacterium]
MTATTSTPAQTIKAAVEACLTSGQPLAVDLATLVQASTLPNLPTVPVTITFAPGEDPLAQFGLYRLASLFPGVPVAQWLPRDGFLSPLVPAGNPYIALNEVGFTLEQNNGSFTLDGITVGLTLGQPGKGWSPGDLGLGLSIDASLETLNFDVASPFSSPSATAVLTGTLTLGALVLDVTLDCPSFVFRAREQPGSAPTFAALLAGFDLPSPTGFDQLTLSGLNFSVMSRDQAVELDAQIDTSDGSPFPLFGDADFALDSLAVSLSYSPGNASANVVAGLVVMKTIALGASLSVVKTPGNPSPTWTMDVGLDLSRTWSLLYPTTPPPSPVAISLGDLAGAFGLPKPSFVNAVQIQSLSGSGTIESGSYSYGLNLVFDVQWTVASTSFDVLTTVNINSAGGSSIVGVVEIDNFQVTLEWDFGATETFKASTQIGNVDLAGSYSGGIITLNVTGAGGGGVGLGDLIGDFVGIFTGDPFTTLPDPWSLLNDIDMSGLTLAVDANKKTVSISCALSASFLGCSISSIGLIYDPNAAKSGGTTFSLAVEGSFPMLPTQTLPDGKQGVAFDPTQPSSAPTAPGLGAAYVDIMLAALGQRVALSPAPDTVEAALEDIQAIAAAISPTNPLPSAPFDPSAGWLVGARIVLLGQVDVRLVFCDPQIYGLHVIVGDPLIAGAPKFSYLDALKGLSAEILYRKVSDTIGVYEGFLTLPDTLRKIDMGAFELQLPSFSVEYFTNGDFEIDIGYPANGDFSNSMVLSAAEFYGSGGILFAKLSQATAPTLPQNIATYTDAAGNTVPVGSFGTVIEIGLGVQVGIYKSFSAGPLSASLGVLLQGMFQGTFAKFTTLPIPSAANQQSAQYYQVYASISIIGKLEGEIDFVIITASLLVEIVLSAAIYAEAYKQVVVPLSASVDVELTVTINCGLFKIHIHVGFSTTISYTAKFGSDSTPLWAQVPAGVSAHALKLARAAPPRSMAFLAAAPGGPTWAPLACAALPLNLYVQPQLTLSPASPTGWTYIVQGALMSPQAVPQGVTPTPTADTTFATDAVALMTAWMLQSYIQAFPNPPAPPPGPPSPPPPPPPARPATLTPQQQFYSTITVEAGHLSGLQQFIDTERVKDPSIWALPTPAQLQAFFAGNMALTAAVLPPSANPAQPNQFGLGFFPMPPGVILTSTDGAPSPVVDQADLKVLTDYVLITVLSALHSAEQALGNQASINLLDLFDTMGLLTPTQPSALGSAVGQGTRFLLHGVQFEGVALYSATGQEIVLSNLTDPAIGLTLTANGDWGLSTGGTFLNVPAPYFPAQIATFATGVDETGITAAKMTLAVTAPKHFTVAPGLGSSAGVYVRGFPAALPPLLDDSTAFKLQTIDANGVISDVPASAYQWCGTVSFTVRRTPAAGSTSAKPSWLPGVYTLSGVQADGLEALEAIFTGANSLPPSLLELAFVEPNSKTLSMVTVSASTAGGNPPVFMFRSNLSTETNPSPVQTFAAHMMLRSANPNADLAFISNLMTGGLTNSGGYYMVAPRGALPDDLFDTSGLAHLQLVVSFDVPASSGGYVLPPVAVNAVRVSDPAVGAEPHVFVASDAIDSTHATVPVGTAGLTVLRPTPANPATDPTYQASLDNMFNLLVCAPAKIVTGAGSTIAVSAPPRDAFVTGPATSDSEPGKLIYSRLYDLLALTGNAWPANANAQQLMQLDPYLFVGGSLSVAYAWADLYGDQIPSGLPETTISLGYTDPLGALSDWPGLSYGYTVEGQPGSRTLTLHRAWVTDLNSGSDPAQIANLKQQYATLYHQLGDVTASLSVSFLASGSAPLPGVSGVATQLRADIATILAALDNLPAPPPPPPAGQSPAPIPSTTLPPIVFTLPASGYDPEPLNELGIQLTFTRNGPIDPDFANEPTIKSSTTVLSPFGAAGSSTQTYRTFAANFEQALSDQDMRVLVGDTSTATGAQLWVMRYGASGVGVSLGWSAAYAPPPFWTTLLSRASIEPTLLPSTSPFAIGTQSVTDADIDVAFGAFLAAVEQFLDPAYGVPAFVADSSAVTSVLNTKQGLAKTLANRMLSLSDGSAGAAEAIEVYRQACLIDLTNYYAVDAVAQFALTTSLGGPALTRPMDLYGRAVGPGGTPDVTVSPAKALMSGTSAIAFSLDAKHKGEHADGVLPSVFQIDAFEVLGKPITVGGATYDTGTWLRFVTPGVGQEPLPNQHPVLLPLRAYPRVPVINSQDFSGLKVSGSDWQQVVEAEEWSLDLGYTHAFVAEDTVWFTATLNIPADSDTVSVGASPGDVDDDLLDTLVQFNAYYAQLAPIFDEMRQGKAPSNLNTALDAFATIAQGVAASVAVPVTAPAPSTQQQCAPNQSAATGYDFAFSLVEGFDDTLTPAQAPWTVTITSCPNNPTTGPWMNPLPEMTVMVGTDAYTRQASPTPAGSQTYQFADSAGKLLMADAAMQITQRMISAAPLNVIDVHNGRARLSIWRNAGMPAPFVYATPEVQAVDRVLPFLEHTFQTGFDIRTLPGTPPTAATLSDTLTRLYVNLVAGASGLSGGSGSVQTEVSLTFPVQDANVGGLPDREVPILLSLPTPIPFHAGPSDVATLVQQVTTALAAWRTNNGIPASQNAKLRFAVSLFSDSSETGMPIVQLDGLVVPVHGVTWN